MILCPALTFCDSIWKIVKPKISKQKEKGGLIVILKIATFKEITWVEKAPVTKTRKSDEPRGSKDKL